MLAGTIQVSGKRFVIVPEAEYDRLRQRASVADDIDLPEVPRKLTSGNDPAVEALRVGLARKLVKRRWSVGLSQAELARRAGIRPETLNRIEKAKVTADTATVTKMFEYWKKPRENRQKPVNGCLLTRFFIPVVLRTDLASTLGV